MDENKPWFIDGRTGEQVSYGQLRVALSKGSSPLFQPSSTREALLGITAALAFDAELTLFDADFGPAEIERLGYSTAHLNKGTPQVASQIVTESDLQRRATGGSKARLGLFTSGSTGMPKLVWQSVANLARAVKVSPRRAEAVWALAFNPTHVAGIQVYLQALANGCAVVDVCGLDRVATLAALEKYGVTHLSAAPSFYRLLLPADRPLPAVKSVTLGGESADAQLLGRLAALFPNARIHNVYASTEAGTLLVAEGDTFAIAPGLEDKVVLRDGKLTVHRSLLGEFAGGAATGEWYDTGDVVEIVTEQPLRFRIVARERDWVNVGGSKVNPHEVEAVLGEHTGVAQVRVFGRKNSVMGNILCAEVVAVGGQSAKGEAPSAERDSQPLTEVALRAFAAERLQPFKVPRMIRLVDSLATTRTGKLSRTADGR